MLWDLVGSSSFGYYSLFLCNLIFYSVFVSLLFLYIVIRSVHNTSSEIHLQRNRRLLVVIPRGARIASDCAIARSPSSSALPNDLLDETLLRRVHAGYHTLERRRLTPGHFHEARRRLSPDVLAFRLGTLQQRRDDETERHGPFVRRQCKSEGGKGLRDDRSSIISIFHSGRLSEE